VLIIGNIYKNLARSAKNRTAAVIDLIGLAAVAALIGLWWINEPSYGAAERIAALMSAVLFCGVCIRFVPEWVSFWGGDELADAAQEEVTPAVHARIFLSALAFCAAEILLVYAVRYLAGLEDGFIGYLPFWKCLDSGHYLAIAEDRYLSEGEWDRLVQLVFLPGYPLVVRLFALLTKSYLAAGLLSSALCFACGAVLVFELIRLDSGTASAGRAVRYMMLVPGAFFFAAPMSESLFILLCAACILLVRRGKWYAGCIAGAYAAFTRSLGITLFIPVCFELVRLWVTGYGRKALRRAPALLLIPLGFAMYLGVNYLVSGDAFKFMFYQKEHWGQSLGMFFNTAAYQLREALSSFGKSPKLFWGLWLPNLISCLFSLGVMLCAAKKLRCGYTAWFIAYYAIAIGATWLLSAPRYLFTSLPLIAGLAAVSDKPKADTVLTAVLLPCSVIYLVFFALRWQVW